jgi:hypothetical protein
MFVGEAEFIEEELDYLLDGDDDGAWASAIIEPGFGNPKRLSFAPYTSGNLVHQAYHIKKWQNATGLQVKDLTRIAEFGGGYGASVYIARQLGFTGEYWLFDLPEVSLLQQYYLSNVDVRGVLYSSLQNGGFWMPDSNIDLLIACWSLSEAPVSVRDEFLSDVNSFYYLFAFQDTWHEINNNSYFKSYCNKRSDLTWVEGEACRGAKYLFGK